MARKYFHNTEDSKISRRCANCDSTHTYSQKTKNGVSYKHWYRNPGREDTWLCGKCNKYLRYQGIIPSKKKLTLLREQRLQQRTCFKCGGKTWVRKVGTASYHTWHRNANHPGTWLCATCYARKTFAPKKKSKTKKQQYQYLATLFSGSGNPMYNVHLLGRIYTAERNRKVSKGKEFSYPPLIILSRQF
jgi:hypothetical protein